MLYNRGMRGRTSATTDMCRIGERVDAWALHRANLKDGGEDERDETRTGRGGIEEETKG